MVLVVGIDTAHDYVYDENNGVGKGCEDADQEMDVVALTYAVVKPHAVVIELVYASVTGSAMLAVCIAVAIAELAV